MMRTNLGLILAAVMTAGSNIADLQKAESIGSHLHKHIKPKHKFTKLDK